MRKLHRFVVPFCSAPILVVTLTGILLLLRSNFDWLQPQTRQGSAKGITLNVADFLNGVVAEGNQSMMTSIHQVKEVRIIPAKGVMKILFYDNIEYQYDTHTGALLHQGKKWSSLLVSIHEGTFFSQWARPLVFLPAAILLLVLWVTGIALYVKSLVRSSKGVLRNWSERYSRT